MSDIYMSDIFFLGGLFLRGAGATRSEGEDSESMSQESPQF